MKAFISYSHQDGQMLDILHKHLSQLQRDGIISNWTDNKILAGEDLNQNISQALKSSNLFIALLSPDYIASNYCYNDEFKNALELQEQGKIIIIPIILEPCDCLNTPFKKFKALPKDGKAVSTWENKNTAFLDIVQNIRKLIDSEESNRILETKSNSPSVPTSRNYRVQKDFDSIEKIEFTEKTFHEVKEHLKRYMEEVTLLDNIKTRVLNDNRQVFDCLLVNRNKIATESELKLSIGSENSSYPSISSADRQITYSINSGIKQSKGNFTLTVDEYHLFWSENRFYSYSHDLKEFGSKEISEKIWDEWLASVGIV